MNNEEMFSRWAPEESPWSAWAKPVLFAHADRILLESPGEIPTAAIGWVPPATERTALVVDLPGTEGVSAGLALAEYGYRPVPLYNAVPLPSDFPPRDPLTGRSLSVVQVLPILHALITGAEWLAQIQLPPDAPPAFLLDANRGGDGSIVTDDLFDNRSVSFTTDFPSANFLATQGIRRAMLIQKIRMLPQPDLAHTLRRWQDGGLSLELWRPDHSTPPEPLVIARPSWYGAMFQRVLAAAGLRRAYGGGFGAWMQHSSSGG